MNLYLHQITQHPGLHLEQHITFDARTATNSNEDIFAESASLHWVVFKKHQLS
jgi:hypothetical protein